MTSHKPSSRRPSSRRILPLAITVATLLASRSVQSVPYTWIGATGDAWNTNSNWSGNVVPSILDDLTILGPSNVAGALTINFNANNSANSLNFTNTAATSVTNSTSGANVTLTLGSGGITTGTGAVQLGANVLNQAVNITLNAPQTWNVGAGGLTVTNFIGGSGTGLTKTGSGNLTINTGAANGFTGGLNANGGTLTLNYANLATPTDLINAANALRVNNGALTITGKASGTTSQTFAGTTLGAGLNTVNITRNGTSGSATLNLGALTVNSGSLTTFSPSTAWTTTASTTEIVRISAGGSVPSLPTGSNTAFVNAGVFHRVSGGAAGTLRLAAVNSSGQLLLKGNAGNVSASVGVDPTNTYQYGDANNYTLTNTAASVYGLLLNATSNGVTLTTAASGTLTLNSIIQIKASEGVNINAGTGGNLIIGSERNLVIAMDNTAGLGIGAPIANNGSTGGTGGTASALTIVGNTSITPGTVTLGGANTFSGPTTITRGTLALGNANALQNTSAITLGGASGATLQNSGDTTGIVIAAPITIANSGVTSTISFSRSTSAVGSMTLNGSIGGNGNVTFTTPNVNSGNNLQTINLGAAATYAGNTTLNTGNAGNTLTLRNSSGSANVLPTTTVLTFGTNAGSGSGRTTTFELNGQNQTLAGLSNGGVVPNSRNHTVNNSGAAATLTINNTSDFTFGGGNNDAGTQTRARISGAISLIKSGTGTFTLGGTLTGGIAAQGNTFNGTTTVLGGILVLGESISIQNSIFDTTASITGTTTDGLRAGIGGTGVTALTLGGLSGNKNFADVFTTTTGGYGNVTALALNTPTGTTPSYSGNISNGASGMSLIKSGAGTQILSGNNTFTGGLTINAGMLQLGSVGALNGTVGSENVVTFGAASTGTLALVGNSVVIANLSSNVVPGTPVVENANASNAVLTVGNSTNASGVYAGTIQDGTGGGTLGLSKVGTGSLTLAGASTYSGATTIDAGKLVLNSALTASTVALNSGTFTGSGTVTNAVNVANTAAAILSNNDGVAGAALTIGSLTFNGAATVNTFTNGASAPIATTSLNTNAAGTVTINPSATVWALGDNHLISYSGTIGGAGFGQFVLGTVTGLTGRQSGTLTNVGGTAVALTVNGDTPVWSGVGTGNWTTATTGDDTGPNDWARKLGNNATNFWVGDGVEFNDTYNVGAGPQTVLATTVNIPGADVSPTSTVFNNSSVNYALTSTGGFGIASGSLTKNGTGTLTITNANTYTGPTAINGGVLQFHNVGALGTNGTILFGGGTLMYGTGIATDLSSRFSNVISQAYKVDTNGNDVTFASALASSGGTFTKVGAGILTLTGANSYSGGTTVSGGTLRATSNPVALVNAIGTGAASIAGGSTLMLDVAKTTNVTDTIANTFTGSGLLRVQFAAGTTARTTTLTNLAGFGGTLQLSTVGATGDKLQGIAGTLPGSLVVDSGTTYFLTNGNSTSFTGGITINGAGNSEGRGAIRVATANTQLGGNISLASSSTISMEVVSAQITGDISSSVPGAILTLGGTTGSVGGILSGNISDGTGTATLTVTQATGSYTLPGILSHTGGVNVSGSGILTLSNASNTYTGVTAIGAAANRSLLVTANNALGATGAGNETTIGAAGQLGFSGGINYSAAERIIGSGTGNTAGQGVFTNLQRGFIQSVSGNNTFAGDIELNVGGNSRIGTQDGAQLTLTGAITQGTGITDANILFRTGNLAGDFVTLSNSGNSFGGDSTLFTGLAVAGQYAGLRIGVDNAHPTNLTVALFASAGGTSSALDLNGKQQTLNGLTNTGAGTLNIINLDLVNASTLTLNPTANRTNAAGITILGGSPGGTPLGTINLVKSGSFSQTLVSAHSYTGTTSVTGGTLALGSTGDINSSSGITVNGAGATLLQTSTVAISPVVTLTQGTLTGNGTVNTVNVGAGTGGIVSNNNGVAGASLTIGALTFNGGATVNTFSSTTAAPIVTTTLTSNAAGIVTINANAASWTVGTPYDLISYTGGSIGGAGFGQFAVGSVTGAGPRQARTLGNSGTAITLTLGPTDSVVWSGANGSNWTTVATGSPVSGTPNWALKTGLAAADFFAADVVEFNDTYDVGGGTQSVTQTTVDIPTANVSPASTTFNNSSVNYTLGSTGGFGIATGSLSKNGTGTLAISSVNTYTGATAINAGAVTLSGSGTLGTGSALTLAGGGLNLGGSSQTVGAVSVTAAAGSGDTISNGSLTGTAYAASNTTGNAVISANLLANGTAAFAKTGAGTVTLSGNNTYTGATTVTGGTLVIGAGSSSTLEIALSGGTGTTLIVNSASATGTGAIRTLTGVTTPSLQFRIDGGGIINLPNALGGNSNIVNSIHVDNNGSGTNGVIQLNGTGSAIGTSTYNITGGNGYSLYIASLTSSAGSAGNITFNPTTANVELGNLSSSSNNTKTLVLGGTSSGNAVSGVIANGTSGTFAVTKSNTSTWTLSGTSTYTGATNVNGGTLLVSGSISGTSAVNVNSTGTLGGGGSINPAVTVNVANGGTLAPGASIGTLSTGSVTLASGATFALEINTTSLTTDLLSSSGTVALNLATLSPSDLGSTILNPLDTFTFITATSVTGTFAGLTQGAGLNVGLNSFTINYTPTSVQLIAVPEPMSYVTLVGGLGTLALLRRRNRR